MRHSETPRAAAAADAPPSIDLVDDRGENDGSENSTGTVQVEAIEDLDRELNEFLLDQFATFEQISRDLSYRQADVVVADIELAALREQLDAESQRIADERAVLERTSTELDAARCSAAEIDQSERTALAARIAELEVERSRVVTELEQSRQEVTQGQSAIEAKLAELRTHAEESEQLRSEIADKATLLDQLEQSRQQLIQQHSDAIASATATLSQRVAQLENEQQRLQLSQDERSQQLTVELADAARRLDELKLERLQLFDEQKSALAQATAPLHERIELLEAEIDRLEADQVVSQIHEELLTETTNRLAAAEQELADAQQAFERQRAETELAHHESQTSLLQRVRVLESELNETTESLGRAELRVAEASSRSDADCVLAARTADLEALLAQATADLTQRSQLEAELQAAFDRLVDEREDLVTRASLSDVDRASIDAELLALREQLVVEQDRSLAVGEQLSAEQDASAEVTDRCIAAERQCESLQAELAKRAALSESLSGEVEQLRADLESARSAPSAGGRGSRTSDRELEALKDELREARHERRMLESELDLVRSRAADLSEQLSEERRRTSEERTQWAGELRQMRRVLEMQSQAMLQGRETAQPAVAARPKPAAPVESIHRSAGEGDAAQAVVDTVRAQFESLQRDRQRRRQSNLRGHQEVA